MRLRAHAKINLDLRVGPLRADGYHDLSTVFQSLALHDVVTVEAVDGPLEVISDTPEVPGGRANLCARAVDALWRATGRPGEPAGWRVGLEKRIPAAGGLGGGSSDAAAVLRALAGSWGLSIDDPRVQAAARAVGADVPYFFVGGTALGTGRGDVLTPLADQPRAEVVLVQPPFGLSTAEVYRLHDEVSRGAHAWATGGALTPASSCRNDLERAVGVVHPEIPAIVAHLRRLHARAAAMTGSGSTVFGLFATAAIADRAAEALRDGARRVIRTATIGRGGCLDPGDA